MAGWYFLLNWVDIEGSGEEDARFICNAPTLLKEAQNDGEMKQPQCKQSLNHSRPSSQPDRASRQ